MSFYGKGKYTHKISSLQEHPTVFKIYD